MEKIQRRLLMLRPTDGFSGCTDGAALRLQTENGGVSATLSAAGLRDSVYDVYLLLLGGEYRAAGQIRDGALSTSVPDIALDDIVGAAVLHTEDERPVFCLVSTGTDWHDAAVRYKITHMLDRPADTGAGHKDYPADTNTEDSRPAEAVHRPATETPLHAPPPKMPVQEAPAAPPQTQNRPCDVCPHAPRQRRIDPFPSVFPGSEWIKVSYPGPTGWWHYITGTVQCTAAQSGAENIRSAKAVGVPGDYSMTPPVWLEGFNIYLHSASEDARGYWLLFQDAETGDVLNMDLSRHGG